MIPGLREFQLYLSDTASPGPAAYVILCSAEAKLSWPDCSFHCRIAELIPEFIDPSISLHSSLLSRNDAFLRRLMYFLASRFPPPYARLNAFDTDAQATNPMPGMMAFCSRDINCGE